MEVSNSHFDNFVNLDYLTDALGVKEYWVVNVNAGQVIAFALAKGGSNRIQDSQVLPGLQISLIEEALKRSLTEDDGAISRWLLAIVSQS